MADWSNLSSDLLSLIISHLPELRDLIRFSSVCPQWHSFINDPQNPNPHLLPWLLLPSHSPSLTGNLSFFSLSEHRRYTFSVPEIINHNIFTSAYGWLIAVFFDAKKKQSLISLVNPITRRTISLPPLSHPTPIPQYENFKLLESPPSIAVVIVRLNSRDTYICHVGNSTWKKLHPPMNFDCIYTDFAIHDRQLFMINNRSTVTHVFDLDTCMCVAEIMNRSVGCYKLVETPNGELFLLYGDSGQLRLEGSGKERKWVNVESFGFGGYSLVLNRSHTMCFDPNRYEGWKRNYVYFLVFLEDCSFW